MATERPQRACARKGDGSYRMMLNDGIDTTTLDNIGSMEDIYEVERVVEVKRVKGTLHYLVLWKNYPKEDASWLPSSEITALPVQLFYEPQPPVRLVLDGVSNLVMSFQASLKAGILRRRIISLEFPRHVFNFLFNGKGTRVEHRSGKLYEREDFPDNNFNDSHFEYFNKHKEVCCICFPLYMNSFVKFSCQSFSRNGDPLPRGFTETLTIRLTKKLIK